MKASAREWLALTQWVALLVLAALPSQAGVFLSAEESARNRITHPSGYTGTGGTLNVDVCIDSASPNAAAMVRSVENVVATVNAREVFLRNLYFSAATNIPSGSVDFESVALHEVGHCIGLAHANLASESGLLVADQDYAKSADGPDNSWDLDDGADDLLSTGDDQRDDDTSFHYFDTSTNDPYRLTASVVDSTTYSNDLGDLPGGDVYPATAERFNAGSFSLFSAEAVMNQGTSFNEEQRLFSADDVSAIRYAMSGLDELAGTSDDYVLQLNYIGLASSCDIKLAFDDVETTFAVCRVGWQRIGNPTSSHDRIFSAEIYFNSGWNWFFNDESCGNGAFEGIEECDDGNVSPGDGCDPTCRIETGSTCTGTPSVCSQIICGNSLVQAPETCDDGGTIGGDGCDAVCQEEPGWMCSGEPSSCAGICGDGLIRGAETCDDGGTAPGDGCDGACQVELTWTCTGEPSLCNPPHVPAVGAPLRLLLGLGVVALAAAAQALRARRRSA